jgi:hypothetical protein
MTYDPTREEVDLAEVRARLRKMSDAELERFGRAAKYMASPAASYGPPRPVWGLQLAEARAEWAFESGPGHFSKAEVGQFKRAPKGSRRRTT